uniref:X-ray radiation resistance-associated protein 1-like n=1 Tax=Sinocyclocheilus anshuiensis TaxID=1608454 RepID=A0A671LUB5_9TELE
WLVANRDTLEDRTSKRKNISGSRFEVHSGKHEKRQPESASNCLDAQLFVRMFPALRELELSLNSLHNLEIHAEDFQKLEVLDLSFNNLTGESIINLGLLPRLKVLHLTGNRLQMLPLNMAEPFFFFNSTERGVLLFQTLEVLMLDDNKLSSPGVFMSLANLKRLRHLNLQGNYISGVPFLEKVATLQDAQTGIMPQSIGQNDKSCLEMHSGALQYCHQRKEDGCALGLCLPFPELRHLNLANNEIAEEEALLPMALFPKLNELVIHSNPLTTQRSGDPPMLTCFLQDKLGIKITRKKTTVLIKRHIILPVSPKRKVKSTVPNVPKFPLITANQHATEMLRSTKCTGQDNPLPLEYGLSRVFGFSSQTSIDDEEDIAIGQEHFDLTSADIFFETNQNAEPFFVTEVILFAVCLLVLSLTSLDAGIQQAVSVLEHMLKNLLVYRDSKANLDLPQKPYTKREKKVRGHSSAIYSGKKVEELLAQIKEAKTIIKVPLGNRYFVILYLLEGGNGICKREYKEALTLLKDMKRKYRTAHLKRVEQAAQIEDEMMCNLN